MLRPFHVLEPTTVAEATTELDRLGDQARVYAGGAELVLLMRLGLLEPDYLVNVKGIPALDGVVLEGEGVRIGATVTHHGLERDPVVLEHLPLLAYAESQVANPRVRNQGTLGGNLCFADPHSDPHAPLLVHEATVMLAGKDRERRLPLDEFLLGTFETALEPDEILCEVLVPELPAGYGSACLRIERFQRPTLNVAVAVQWEKGRVQAARLAVGCIGSRALRLTDLEQRLQGLTLDEARRVLMGSKSHLREELRPEDDLLGSADYKTHVTAVQLSRALSQSMSVDGEETRE